MDTIPSLLSPNRELSDLLKLIGDYYTLSKEQYRARAFITASIKIGEYPYHIASGDQARRDISGIGPSIEASIDEYMLTGSISRLKEMEALFK